MTPVEPAVLVIQHVAVEGLGLLQRLLTTNGLATRLVPPGAPLPDAALARHRGVIVLGGPMGVYDAAEYPRLREETELLRAAVAAKLPVLGICLGSQLLAAALGAKVYPGAQKELGWFDVTLEPAARDDALFRELPPRFKALHWHGDVFDLPEGAALLARSELTAHQAFSYGDCAWGLLFHLEAGPEEVDGMLHAFPDEVRAAGQSAEALLAATRQHAGAASALAATVFQPWLDRVRG